ncbi:esterase E4-like [Nomia melanderi]|uniref:esterase E4-like n=1 Tax=Nomia melanderi TaxID=2448451 RepID=UPI0013041492|nr:esterase E4-like [Nomia melanderi]
MEPVVTVRQGRLKGCVQKSTVGTKYLAFFGIPYATPPVGDLRFKDPKPPERWQGIKDCMRRGVNVCPQRLEFPPYEIIGSENCLFLNVYTNSLSSKKPVMFWIHGGSFIGGAGSFATWGPDYFMPKNVVVVSPNYRVGALGFLNLGLKDAAGNMGLKDLIQALKWVKANAATFGGDPNNITVFGFSAGAVLGHAMAISPLSQGLFHKLILQSGGITVPWGHDNDRKSFKLASILGLDTTNPVKILEYMKKLSIADIVKAQDSILSCPEAGMYQVCFGLTNDTASENPTFPLPIEQLIPNDSKIPIIVGHVSHEFIMLLKEKTKQSFDSFNKYLPHYLEAIGSLRNLGPEEMKQLTEAVKKRYFKELPADQDQLQEVLEFGTDAYFVLPLRVYVEDRLKRTSTPTYFYNFSYYGNQKTHTDFILKRYTDGPTHSDDLAYLFNLQSCKRKDEPAPARGTTDRAVMECYTTMWANFAKTGNPTPVLNDVVTVAWEPATEEKFNCLEINAQCKLVELQPHILDSI